MERHKAPQSLVAFLCRDQRSLLCVIDAHGSVTSWSATAASLFGHSPAEAVGHCLGDLLEIELPWQTGGYEWHGISPVRHRDRSLLHLPLSAYLAPGDRADEPLWLLIMEVEPTAPVNLEEQERSHWTPSNSPIPVSILDTDVRCIRQNAAMRKFSGISDEKRIIQAALAENVIRPGRNPAPGLAVVGPVARVGALA
ncbi:PAS domain-containing protein [Streptomyces sp. NPDC020845]|uniref:PAS domain-containing protein n=1 Tax=Streptomyces sp. NPDC020845 TaxID=3365096 RepID=UPI00378E25CD